MAVRSSAASRRKNSSSFSLAWCCFFTGPPPSPQERLLSFPQCSPSFVTLILTESSPLAAFCRSTPIHHWHCRLLSVWWRIRRWRRRRRHVWRRWGFGAKDPIFHSLLLQYLRQAPRTQTQIYLPRINDSLFKINDAKISADAPSFVVLHRSRSMERPSEVVNASSDRVQVVRRFGSRRT